MALGVGGLVSGQAAAGVGLPQFGGEVTVADDLDYAPTGEFIFSSVFHAGEYLADPLGEWYPYYAPHENPGEISFVYANSLAGPWTGYDANSVVSNVWAPIYSVPHVASPEAFWNEQEQHLFLRCCAVRSPSKLPRDSVPMTTVGRASAKSPARPGPSSLSVSASRHHRVTSARERGRFDHVATRKLRPQRLFRSPCS